MLSFIQRDTNGQNQVVISLSFLPNAGAIDCLSSFITGNIHLLMEYGIKSTKATITATTVLDKEESTTGKHASANVTISPPTVPTPIKYGSGTPPAGVNAESQLSAFLQSTSTKKPAAANVHLSVVNNTGGR